MHKWGEGTLRSGNKETGKPVRSQKQAVAIMLSEKRAARGGKREYQASGGTNPMIHARKPQEKTLGGKTFTSHPGRLHRELGIPLGENIPEEKKRAALHSKNPQTRRDARAAIGYAAMNKG